MSSFDAKKIYLSSVSLVRTESLMLVSGNICTTARHLMFDGSCRFKLNPVQYENVMKVAAADKLIPPRGVCPTILDLL